MKAEYAKRQGYARAISGIAEGMMRASVFDPDAERAGRTMADWFAVSIAAPLYANGMIELDALCSLVPRPTPEAKEGRDA